MPRHVRDFVDYAPLFAVIVALSSLGVALMQAYVQRQHLKQNLFEKRFMVYASTRDFRKRFSNDPSELDLIQNFVDSTAHASFLFGDNVSKARDGIALRAIDIFHLKSRFDPDNIVNSDLYRRYVTEKVEQAHERPPLNRELEAMVWLEQMMRGQLNPLFGPYLQLCPKRNWFLRFVDELDRWVDSSGEALQSRYVKPLS